MCHGPDSTERVSIEGEVGTGPFPPPGPVEEGPPLRRLELKLSLNLQTESSVPSPVDSVPLLEHVSGAQSFIGTHKSLGLCRGPSSPVSTSFVDDCPTRRDKLYGKTHRGNMNVRRMGRTGLVGNGPSVRVGIHLKNRRRGWGHE